MDNIQLVQILNSRSNLMEKFDRLWLFNPVVFHDIIKKFTTAHIFHDQVELLWCLNNFVELNNVRMPDHFEDMDLTRYSFDIVHVLDFIFFKNFYRNLLTGAVMNSELHFSESTLANSFT